jgi:hypothetical protein
MDYLQIILQYIISPAVMITAVLWVLSKSFNLGQIVKQIDDTAKDIDSLKKDSKHLINHVSIMKTHLVTNSGLDANLFGPGSPLKLLPNGKKLLNKSKFVSTYNENKDWFVTKVEDYEIISLADLDEACSHILYEFKDTTEFINFKEVSFNNGVTVDVLIKVLAIYLRNELSKELGLK